ncbi:sulfite exporter TauE/SafE family protein [Peribacillus sp. NPDC097295]|uniref:sulfite exporter TauE/SafE family protein n=1 Tax=Peribacillus sp. NPDC097295 TaxID=3364402 RepID=UPI0037F5CDC8
MKKLMVLAFIGFLAQLIDGSLGMGYGVSSSSLLLTFGIVPAVASASVHLSEVVTTAVSGASHIKFGNVDKNMVLRLIIPGSIGAFVGACFLSNLPAEIARPYIAIFLLGLGIYVLFRFLFIFKPSEENESFKPLTAKQSIPLGLFAGFCDATGGGGWGPIATPVLLSKKGMTARKAVGTIDTSEFAIAFFGSLGFILSLGWGAVNWFWVAALIIGGVVAAPIAAYFVRILPAHLMGVLVGGFIILTNIRTVLSSWVPEDIHSFIYVLVLIAWLAGIYHTATKMNATKNQGLIQQKQNVS